MPERRRINHPIVYAFSVAILVVIGITFIGGPVISSIAGPAELVFGSYAGEDIAYFPGNFFDAQIQVINDRYSRQEDTSLDSRATAYSVWREAFEQTVVHTAILVEARSGGLIISEGLVGDALIRSGSFDESRWRSTSNTERQSTWNRIREGLLFNQYLRDVQQENRSSSYEIEYFKQMATPERKFGFVSFRYADFPDEEIRIFGEENREQFSKIKLSTILIRSGRNEAEEVRRKILAGDGSFEDLAKIHSTDSFANKGGDQGWRFFHDLSRDFDEAESASMIFSLRVGEVSDVLENRFGFAIYRPNEDAVAADFSDEETIEEVRRYLSLYERGHVEDHYIRLAEDFQARARADGFETAAEQLSLPINETEFFTINYQNVFAVGRVADPEGRLTSAAYYESFFENGFSLSEQDVSDPVIMDDQILVLRLLQERFSSGDDLDRMESYHGVFVTQAIQRYLERTIFESDKLVDRFNEVFDNEAFPSSPTGLAQ